MLKWKQIAEDFISIDVGKEYNEKPYYWTTFYYYKGLVIDTGCPHTAEESANFLETMKLNVKAVLLTHHHEDHSGGAYLFKERFHATVFAPKKSLNVLANPPEIPPYRQFVWGQPKPLDAVPLESTMRFNNLTFTIIETLGHSFDHVSFLVRDIIFVGDLVANLAPVIIMKEEDYIDLIDSLNRIMNLDFETAYGGHGIWDKNDIKITLDNILRLKEKIYALWRKGLNTDQIVKKIFSDAPKKVFLMEELSEHEWSRKNLVESILGMRHKPSSYVRQDERCYVRNVNSKL